MDDICFQWLFNSCRIQDSVPCGGHPLTPSGPGRSCRLDGECLVKEERRGSVQGCRQTEHMVNQPDCPLVVETLKTQEWMMVTTSKWCWCVNVSLRFVNWALGKITSPISVAVSTWILYQTGSMNLDQGTLRGAWQMLPFYTPSDYWRMCTFGLISDLRVMVYDRHSKSSSAH